MRVLVISDIHANLTAFQAVLDHAQGQWDYVWCLGDVVGYGPDPNECVELLRTMPHLCLAGNHDWAALGRVDTRNFNPNARAAAAWTAEVLTAENIAYLEALPITFVIDNFTLVHASPRDPVMEYILDNRLALANLAHFETAYCFVGHTHVPIIYEANETHGDVNRSEPRYGQPRQLTQSRQIINPGSIGQPRDGNPNCAYALFDTTTLTWEHRRIPYDIASVQERMRAANLPDPLITRLEHGL